MRLMIWTSTLLLVSGCHLLRPDAKPASPDEVCRTCCQQTQDACKMENDHPAYYCPRDFQECVTACGANDENHMCVLETNRQFAKSAPKPMLPPAPAGPAVAIASVSPTGLLARGECDSRGLWNLTIGDAKGRGAGCDGLRALPRDVRFRIERQKDVYTLRDLVPVPGWEDGFVVENHPDLCQVTLTRAYNGEGERPRVMTVQLSEKDGNVEGTFTYREEMPRPATCELDAQVTGLVEALPPRPAPLPSPPPLPPQPQPRSMPSLGAGQSPTGAGHR
jgi:hypothetical protein